MLEVENETRSKILNDSSGCFMHLTRNMISRSSNQYIRGSMFFYLNTRSIVNKLFSLQAFIYSSIYSIFCFTET